MLTDIEISQRAQMKNIRDIAADLGIQPKSVRMALTRARKTARLLMDET